MKARRAILSATLALGCLASLSAKPNGAPSGDWNETIILIRHGEKPTEHPVGQLNCQGLQRALALPSVLTKYGRPTAIYAPNPNSGTTEGDPLPGATRWSYIRPLMTIEPYAVSLGMPINTQVDTKDLNGLQNALFQPAYSHALVVVAWEHIQAWKFAEQLLSQYHMNPELAPHWHDDQYDTIYVFHFFTGPDGQRKLEFKVDAEQLDGRLPSNCPVVALK